MDKDQKFLKFQNNPTSSPSWLPPYQFLCLQSSSQHRPGHAGVIYKMWVISGRSQVISLALPMILPIKEQCHTQPQVFPSTPVWFGTLKASSRTWSLRYSGHIWLWIKCNIEYANSMFWSQAILIFSSFLITFIVCICIPGMDRERGLVTLNVQYYTLQSSNSRHLIGPRPLLWAARVSHASQNVFRIFKKRQKIPTTIQKCKRENHLCCKFNLHWGLHLLSIDSDFSFCVPSECSHFKRIADVVGTAVLFPL